jgi:hypothetical protein
MVGSAIEGASSQTADQYRLAVGHAAYDLDPRLLDDLPLVEPDEGLLLRALAAAVDFARYWQEPDGEDVLAAAREMRDALARVATGVAQSPLGSCS